MKFWYQLVKNVQDNTVLGQSKRTDKLNPDAKNDGAIYSWQYSKDVQAEAKEFGKWVMTYDHGVHQTTDLTAHHYGEFLAEKKSKVEKGELAPETYNKHVTLLTKLSNCNRAKYSNAVVISKEEFPHMAKGTTQRDVSFSDKVGNTLVKDMLAHNKGSNAWKAVVLSTTLGLRNRESVEVRKDAFHLEGGGRWGYGYVELEGKRDGCKGGRARHIDVLSAEDQRTLRSLTNSLEPTDRVVTQRNGRPYTGDAITRAMGASYKRLGLNTEEIKGNKQHALRKGFAQRCYDMERKESYRETDSKKRAMDYSNAQLGHGKNRVDDNKRYVANAW